MGYSDILYFLQVVPPDQARKIYKALKENGLPVALVEYEGEQHGFRKVFTILRDNQLQASLYIWVYSHCPCLVYRLRTLSSLLNNKWCFSHEWLDTLMLQMRLSQSKLITSTEHLVCISGFGISSNCSSMNEVLIISQLLMSLLCLIIYYSNQFLTFQEGREFCCHSLPRRELQKAGKNEYRIGECI